MEHWRRLVSLSTNPNLRVLYRRMIFALSGKWIRERRSASCDIWHLPLTTTVSSHATGRPSATALSAIERLRMSGRRAILLTGRRLDDLRQSCPNLSLFDYVVAENGATIYEPRTREETLLGNPPPAEFIERLKELGVDPLEVGRVIVATWLPHQAAVLQAIQEMGLELHIVFNRTAVMVLPPGVNKATGMEYALRKLGLSSHEVFGVGDSENDHSFLERSECAGTVANAVPSIRKLAAIVAKGENGAGLAELIDELIATDLCRMQGRLQKHLIPIGRRPDGTLVDDASVWPQHPDCRTFRERQIHDHGRDRRAAHETGVSSMRDRSRGGLRNAAGRHDARQSESCGYRERGACDHRGSQDHTQRQFAGHPACRSTGVLWTTVSESTSHADAHRPAALDRSRRGPSHDAVRMVARRSSFAAALRRNGVRYRASGSPRSAGAVDGRYSHCGRTIARQDP